MKFISTAALIGVVSATANTTAPAKTCGTLTVKTFSDAACKTASTGDTASGAVSKDWTKNSDKCIANAAGNEWSKTVCILP